MKMKQFGIVLFSVIFVPCRGGDQHYEEFLDTFLTQINPICHVVYHHLQPDAKSFFSSIMLDRPLNPHAEKTFCSFELIIQSSKKNLSASYESKIPNVDFVVQIGGFRPNLLEINFKAMFFHLYHDNGDIFTMEVFCPSSVGNKWRKFNIWSKINGIFLPSLPSNNPWQSLCPDILINQPFRAIIQ